MTQAEMFNKFLDEITIDYGAIIYFDMFQIICKNNDTIYHIEYWKEYDGAEIIKYYIEGVERYDKRN